MKTAAGQCCFYAVPDRDAQGIGRHYAVRTYETLCDGWLVLHKARRCCASFRSFFKPCVPFGPIEARCTCTRSSCIGRQSLPVDMHSMAPMTRARGLSRSTKSCRDRCAQVEASDQMRYLHHRMQSCPEEQELVRRAAALAAAREPDHPPPLPLRPLQVGTPHALHSKHVMCGNPVHNIQPHGSVSLSGDSHLSGAEQSILAAHASCLWAPSFEQDVQCHSARERLRCGSAHRCMRCRTGGRASISPGPMM